MRPKCPQDGQRLMHPFALVHLDIRSFFSSILVPKLNSKCNASFCFSPIGY